MSRVCERCYIKIQAQEKILYLKGAAVKPAEMKQSKTWTFPFPLYSHPLVRRFQVEARLWYVIEWLWLTSIGERGLLLHSCNWDIKQRPQILLSGWYIRFCITIQKTVDCPGQQPILNYYHKKLPLVSFTEVGLCSFIFLLNRYCTLEIISCKAFWAVQGPNYRNN